MKRVLRGAALLAATSSLLPTAVHAHRTLELDLYRRENNALERRGTVENTLYSLLTWGYYYVNITVGTPPQEQVVIFDTGSSDLYFNKAGSSFCDSSVSECVGGTFDPSQSSTWKDLDLPYMTGYGDPDVPDGIISVNGTYGTDTIGFANLQIPNVQFGLADQDNATGLQQGLVGMSYPYNEAAGTEYPTFTQVLVDAGVIPSRLFSTYLNWVQPVSGSVLFGGIDTSKYEGQLTTINLLGSMGPVVTDFTVAITDITTSSSGNTSNVDLGLNNSPSQQAGLTGIFDTGTPYFIVSTAAYHGIRMAFPYLDSQDNCSCSHRYDDVEVAITFNSAATIKVPGSALILPLYDQTGRPLPYSGSGGGDLCTFVVQPQNTVNELIFGAPVLTAMYVVFDLDNGVVSVAQAAGNSTAAPNIVEVPAGSDGVAGVSASLVSYTNAAQPTSLLSLSVNGSAPTTVSYSANTVASTMGLLTGVAAEPTAARIQSASHGAAARTTAVIGGPLTLLGNLGVWTGCAIGAVAAIGMIAL